MKEDNIYTQIKRKEDKRDIRGKERKRNRRKKKERKREREEREVFLLQNWKHELFSSPSNRTRRLALSPSFFVSLLPPPPAFSLSLFPPPPFISMSNVTLFPRIHDNCIRRTLCDEIKGSPTSMARPRSVVLIGLPAFIIPLFRFTFSVRPRSRLHTHTRLLLL